jgi:hypothetical protein
VALVPVGAVTATSTVPDACAGDTAVIDVPLFTVNDAAAVEPKLTADAPVNPVPVIVTDVPPAVGPAFGETLVTVGPERKAHLCRVEQHRSGDLHCRATERCSLPRRHAGDHGLIRGAGGW